MGLAGQTQTPAKLTRRAVVLCKGGDRHSPHETTRLSVFNLLSFQYLRFCLYHHFILFADLSVVQPTELQAFMANMAMFERAQGVQVSGGTFTINERRSSKHACSLPFHDLLDLTVPSRRNSPREISPWCISQLTGTLRCSQMPS